MKIRKISLFLLLCAGYVLALGGVSLPEGSAFVPTVRSELHYSLLNYPEEAREASIDIYGKGLYHPFTGLPRFRDAFIDAFRMGKARHSLIGYQSPDSLMQAEFNVLAGYEHAKGDEACGFIYKGYIIKAEVAKRLSLNTFWWNGMFMGDKAEAKLSELADGYLKDSADKLRVDNISADISYHAPAYTLALGRGRFPIANSFSGSIILNDEVNDYGYLLAEGKAGDFRLSLLHASLQADSVYAIYPSSAVNSKTYPDKFLALHQLSYTPTPELKLFMGESVVYGNRGIELNYLVPTAFWRATEHNLGDKDNMMVYAGASYQPVKRLICYAQAAFDEFSYNKLFTSWWGNKYALQGGVQIQMPALLTTTEPIKANIELTAVRPFTYTHYMNHTMYSHDGHPLGYPQGSNIVDISLGLNVPIAYDLKFISKLSYSKQGSYGSSWQQNYNDLFAQTSQSAKAKWFQGEVSKRTGIDTVLLIDTFAHHRLLLGLEARYDKEWDSKMYAGWQLHY